MSLGAMLFWGVCIALLVYLVSIYNTLVKLRNRFRNAFAQIDVQLKRRYDLIPNLVETAKAYLGHERQTLEAVTSARNQALQGLGRAAANPTDPDAIRTRAPPNRGTWTAMAAVDGAFQFAEAGPFDLKGYNQPVPAYRVAR